MDDKCILDPIHGYMKIPLLLFDIIDHPIMQRLRSIKQLGLVSYIYPGACHTRFEHSLGVSWLCGEMMKGLKTNQPELKISDRLVLLCMIAGLIHDIGHGPLSHAFDDFFVHEIKDFPYPKEHEERADYLLKEILVDCQNLILTEDEIELVLKMVHPREEDNSWMFEIVANKKNNIDVDKMDYIARDAYHIGLEYSFKPERVITHCRVIDNEICYPDKLKFDLYRLFESRYWLYKQVYYHPVVRGLEIMAKDLWKPKNLPWEDMIDENVINSNFRRKKHYTLMYDSLIMPGEDVELKTESIEVLLQKKHKKKLNLIHDIYKIGWVSGNSKNPLKTVSFFKQNDLKTKFSINLSQITQLSSYNHQETGIRVYSKN